MIMRAARAVALSVILASLAACVQPARRTFHPLFFRVVAGSAVHVPVSGRLLVFVAKGSGAKEVSIDEFHPDATWVAAREVHDLAPGAAVEIDTDGIAYPKPFSDLAPGNYQVQAVLDVGHSYNYSGLTPGDLVTPVLTLKNWTPGDGAEPQLALDEVAPPSTPPELDPQGRE